MPGSLVRNRVVQLVSGVAAVSGTTRMLGFLDRNRVARLVSGAAAA
jgi:hypothetical protein